MFDVAMLKKIEQLQQDKVAFCLVTIVNGRGSIPQEVGAKAIFTREGLSFGTVGGGAIETKCQEKAIELLDRDVPNLLQVWNTTRDLGMTCCGEATLYFEFYRPQRSWNIAVFGAGHVAQKLCRFLAELDCHVTCFDTRPEWLAKLPRNEKVEPRLVNAYADGVKDVGKECFVVLATYGHSCDVAVLKAIEAAKLGLPYVGVIGSSGKAKILKRKLREDGVATAFAENIVSPIGEDFGNNTPPEIALSIAAQLMRRRGQSLCQVKNQEAA